MPWAASLQRAIAHLPAASAVGLARFCGRFRTKSDSALPAAGRRGLRCAF